MNTIPIIFNEKKVPHTVIGGSIKKSDEDPSHFTVILLNRGGRYYRSAVFQNLESAGFSSIISIEMSTEPYDIENLSLRFPSVKFLVPLEKVTVGEMLNTGLAETDAPYVLVLWNDMRLTASSISNRLMDKVQAEALLCCAPQLTSQRMEHLPVQMVPALNKNSLQVEPMPCYRDMSPTIYPADFTGIYDREKCIRLGGFDHTIANPYWQNLDFGFRAHLWGEKIAVSTSFRLSYDGEVPREDITADESYMRFYLKNLAPVYRKDSSFIPVSRFFSYATKAGKSILDSAATFSRMRAWVRMNRYRFTCDAAGLVGAWEPYIQ